MEKTSKSHLSEAERGRATNTPHRSSPKLHETLMGDLRRGDLTKTLRKDLRDTYEFYLDDHEREALSEMGKLKRWCVTTWWLLKKLFLELSPVRRVMLLTATILVIYGFGGSSGEVVLGFAFVLFILILELKDKLLAQDELAAGRAVQLALMPESNPTLAGWRIWLYTTPANDVGGDLVDYIEMGERLGLALGDVAGKGLGAALYMSQLQATLRAFAPKADSLAEMGSQLNEVVVRDRLPNRFASLVYLEMRPSYGRVHVLNAGHMSPMVVRRDSVDEMPKGAVALGILDRASFESQSVDLEPGDLLVVYSDGLTEARDDAGRFFGKRRLVKMLEAAHGTSADALGASLVEAVSLFLGDAPRNDDLSLVVLERVDETTLPVRVGDEVALGFADPL